MIIYYSMIGWVVLCWVISRIAPQLAYYSTGNTYKVKKYFAYFTMAYIILIVGLRSSVGDTHAYIQMFNKMPMDFTADFLENYKKDRGFFVLSILFKKFISTDYSMWFLVIAIISGIAVVKTLYKYSEKFFFSMFLFITMVHFVWMMNGMRQFIVVSILFANIRLIEERKFIKYVILTLLLSTIHVTAIIMIPAYFIAIARPWGKQFWLGVIIILVMGMSIDTIANTFSYVLEDSAYEGYLTAAATSAGSNIFRTLVAAAPPLLAFVCQRFTRAENNSIVNISITLSVLSAVTYLGSVQSGGILIGRLPIYFDIYNLLLLPWLVEHCFTKKSKMILYIVLIICYFMFFYSKVKIGMGMAYSSDILGIYFRK